VELQHKINHITSISLLIFNQKHIIVVKMTNHFQGKTLYYQNSKYENSANGINKQIIIVLFLIRFDTFKKKCI